MPGVRGGVDTRLASILAGRAVVAPLIASRFGPIILPRECSPRKTRRTREPAFQSWRAVASDGSPLAYAGVFGQSFSEKGLYKSTDARITWFSRTFALNVDIDRLAANGSNVLAGGLFDAFYSTDFGEG